MKMKTKTVPHPVAQPPITAWLLPLTSIVCLSNLPMFAASERNLATAPEVTKVHLLSQNWTNEEAERFYTVPQGSQFIPYDWFLHLEQADSQTKLRDESNIRSFGYLPRTPSPTNKDGLPIGFVKDGSYLGLTCAACHTSQINYKGEAWLVDGAPTLADMVAFETALHASLQKTADDTAKFERFSTAVLGADGSTQAKTELRQKLRDTATARKDFNLRNHPRNGGAPYGPGRLDAFGRIMNEVTSTIAQLPDNHFPANAPVSYPFLWDTPQHDKVQWNGAAPNTISPIPIAGTKHIGALGRNTGEVVGVFGSVDASNAGFLGGYRSSVRKKNLDEIEESLRKLWSPEWPQIFGSIGTDEQQLQGKELFDAHCFKCHDNTFDRKAPDRRVIAKMDFVGTDPTMASNFATRTARTGKMKGRLVVVPGFRLFGNEAPIRDMLTHVVQRVILGPGAADEDDMTFTVAAPQFTINAELDLGNTTSLVGAFNTLEIDPAGKAKEVTSRTELSAKKMGDVLLQDNVSFDDPGRFFTKDGKVSDFNLGQRSNTRLRTSAGGTQLRFDEAVPVKFQYKGRPLNGIWATAPYLHNGSVPNLDELLKAPDKRVKKFKVGSREFDPERVGFSTTEGTFDFDSTLPGNSNAGHEYSREFTPEERALLVGYMKSL